MKRTCMWIVCAGLVLSSCRPGAQTEAPAAPKNEKAEPHKEAVSHWTVKLILHALHDNNLPFINAGQPLHCAPNQTI